MAPPKIPPKDLARYAAEGVAIAIGAREPAWRGPIHIICGIPPEIFEVTIEHEGEGAAARVNVGARGSEGF